MPPRAPDNYGFGRDEESPDRRRGSRLVQAAVGLGIAALGAYTAYQSVKLGFGTDVLHGMLYKIPDE